MTLHHYFIDAHAHMTCDELYFEAQGIVHRATLAKVEKIVNICTDRKTYLRSIDLKKRFPHIYNTAAITPHDVESIGEQDFPLFIEAAEQNMLVAIGETGLDYHYEYSKKQVQKDFLRRHIELALEHNLPIVIHCREAFDDLFRIFEEFNTPKEVVLHCFTGEAQEAVEVLKRGWLLSFSGIVTFKKSEALRAIAQSAPIEQLCIETDSPYLAPQGFRGKRNEPAYVVEVAKCLAELKNMPLESFADQVTQNIENFFRI